MKTLLLLRHAKSSWKQPGLDDHDRPLNDRGQRDAPRMGRLIKREGIVPDVIVTSTACRARATAETVAEACGHRGELRRDESLYLAAPHTYLSVASELDPDAGTVMLVGHNPGIEELVRLLTRRDERMSTAALARIDLHIDGWDEVRPGIRGELIHLWRPKELAGTD